MYLVLDRADSSLVHPAELSRGVLDLLQLGENPGVKVVHEDGGVVVVREATCIKLNF